MGGPTAPVMMVGPPTTPTATGQVLRHQMTTGRVPDGVNGTVWGCQRPQQRSTAHPHGPTTMICPPSGPRTEGRVTDGQNGGGRGPRRPQRPWAEPPILPTTIWALPEGPMTTIRAPHAPDDGQRRRGNGGRRRRRGAEGGRAAGTGRMAPWTADVGGDGAGGRADGSSIK